MRSLLKLNHITQGDALRLIDKVGDGTVDLIICDGPYNATNQKWDKIAGGIQQFNLRLIQQCASKLKTGGVMYLFGKHDCIDFIDYRPYLNLVTRIVWYQPSRLSQGRVKYTNNYDVICYFVKGGRATTFNLDDIRVPQLVELTQRLRCERVPAVTTGRFGKTKFNPKGKNPGDVWGDIKQLTYKSKELLSRDMLNTIQKPEKLLRRLILASSNKGDLVLDPFCGAGTSAVICQELKRNFICFEIDSNSVNLANKRIARFKNNK